MLYIKFRSAEVFEYLPPDKERVTRETMRRF
jgi:hypothetical protein